MLQAIERKKVSYFMLGLEPNSVLGSVRRRPVEDMITASVFGPLAFLPANITGLIMERILPEINIERPVECELRFWQSLACAGGGTVEPDIILEFRTQQNETHLACMEIKWNSNFGPHQALNQWEALKLTGTSFDHILLVRDRATANNHLSGDFDVSMPMSPKVITWHDLVQRLIVLPEATECKFAAAWSRSVVSALRVLGERTFDGFSSLQTQVTFGLPDTARHPSLFFFETAS